MTTERVEQVATDALPAKKRKARWNMDATLRGAALVQMALVIADKKTSHAAACKASAVLLRAEAQNQRDEQRRKKKVVKRKVPVLHLGWHGKNVPESEVASKVAEFKRQWKETRRQEAEKGRASGTRRKRERRWNIKPEYRDAMVMRWRMILADPQASQTVKFAVVSLMVRAEAQNQKDEEYRKKNKNRAQEPIIVGTTRDFYKNNAHELAAARAAAEANRDSVVAGAKEDRELGPEVGQHDNLGVDRLKGAEIVIDRAGRGAPLTAARGAATQRPLEDSMDMDRESPVDASPHSTKLGPQYWYGTGPPGRRG